MCCDFTEGWCGHMTNSKVCEISGCKNKATRTAYAGSTGNRYSMQVCNACANYMQESDKRWAGLMQGFAEYNAYYDAKGR